MDLSATHIDELFQALEAHMEAECLQMAIVVVGGASLLAGRMLERTTKDVDVIAEANMTDGKTVLSRATPFSEGFSSAVQRVARDYGLSNDWLNAVIDKQWEFGLPPELHDDINWKTYGCLMVGFVGRKGLIPLKFFAAVDQGKRSKHWQDLLVLAPSSDELNRAAIWVKSQDAGEQFNQFVEEAREQLARELGRNG